MLEWWNALNMIEQVFACIAIPSTVILILQTVLLLFSAFGGEGAHDHSLETEQDIDVEVNVDHDIDVEADIEVDLDHDIDVDLDTDHDIGCGIDHDHSSGCAHVFEPQHDHTDHTDGLRPFTLRGIVAFCSVFGWAGVAFCGMGMELIIVLFLALVLGVLTMLMVAYAMMIFSRLQQDGTMETRTAVGTEGTVYLTIPAAGKGNGKVSVMVSGRYAEYDAVTGEESPILTGDTVTVIGVDSENTLVVMSNNK